MDVCVCAHERCLIWAVSPVCRMEDEDKELSTPRFISGVPVGGDDKLVLTSFVYLLCLDVVCCYGVVLGFNLAFFNFHGSVFCFSCLEVVFEKHVYTLFP